MKFITKKVIKGNDYYYLQYKGYTKLLGRVIPSEIKKKLEDFFRMVAVKEYIKVNSKTLALFHPKKLEHLERYHYTFLVCSESELFQHKYADFKLWFAVFFTFNSNRSEGSKVTRPEIEKVILKNIKKPKTRTDREIYNSTRALWYVLSKDMKWTLKDIKKVHFLLLDGLDDEHIVGRWKNENNVAPGNQPTVSAQEVAVEMAGLMNWLKKEIKGKRYPPLLALDFYSRFERIHPFLDGNGRVGRLLLNGLLWKFRYMPVVFFTSAHQSHCEALRQALDGRPWKFYRHFLDQADKTYKLLVEGG